MRLIRLHIENFGKLSDVEMEFDRPLTVILRENGWGKSTLAAYIRVMFYGFSGGAKRSEIENERRRYRPWGGGAYGGSLTFAVGGEQYRIERIFGSREKDDLFHVFDAVTGRPSDRFSERIGEEIFRIDAESFSRTVFTAQMDAVTGSTPQIHARIGSEFPSGNDMERYGVVKENLKKEMDRLTPNRKTGEIARTREQIARLDNELRTRASSEDALRKVNAEITARVKRKREIDAEQEALTRAASELAGKSGQARLLQQYEGLCEAEKRAMDRAEAIRQSFSGQIPDRETLDHMIREAGMLSGAEIHSGGEHLNAAETEEFNRLIRLFHSGVPEETELDDLTEKTRQMETMKQWLAEHRLSAEEEERLSEESDFFSGDLPEDAEIRQMLSAWERLGQIRSEIAGSEQIRKEMRGQMKRNRAGARSDSRGAGTRRTLLRCAGFLLTTGSAFACIFYQRISERWYLWAVLAAALFGLLLLILSFASRRKVSEQEAFEAEFLALSDRMKDAKANAAELEKQIRDFYFRCGLTYAPNRVSDDLYEIRSRAADLRKLLKKYRTYRSSGYEEKVSEISDLLRDFVNRHHLEEPENGNWIEMLIHLKKDAGEYRILSARSADARKGREAIREKKAQIEEFLREIGVRPAEPYSEQLTEIRDRVREYRRHAADCREMQAKRAEFEAEHEEIRQLGNISAEGINGDEINRKNALLEEEEERIMAEKRRYDAQAESLREELARLDEAEGERDVLRGKMEKLQHRYRVLSGTAEFLGKAAARYSARFLDPVSRSFRKYYRLLTGEEGDAFRMDSALAVRVTECGALREEAYFSAGIRDLIGMCSRMAMTDAIYPEEKPFLVFDDPFVNLDDERRKNASRFLHEIAKDYQVIIMTCRSENV